MSLNPVPEPVPTAALQSSDRARVAHESTTEAEDHGTLARRLERKRRRQAGRRREILDVARHVLLETGIGEFTLARVAARAHITKPALYYYFPSKEAIIDGMASDVAEAERDAVDAAIASASDVPHALECALRAYVAFHAAEPDLFRILHAPSGAIDLPGGTRKGNHAERIEHWTSLLRRRLCLEDDGLLHAGSTRAFDAVRSNPTDDAGRRLEMALVFAHGLVCLWCAGAIAGAELERMTEQACRSFRHEAERHALRGGIRNAVHNDGHPG